MKISQIDTLPRDIQYIIIKMTFDDIPAISCIRYLKHIYRTKEEQKHGSLSDEFSYNLDLRKFTETRINLYASTPKKLINYCEKLCIPIRR